jgi:hypothetical protein
MQYRKRDRTNGTKNRNKTISWREDDNKLLEMVYEELHGPVVEYSPEGMVDGEVGPSAFMHEAKGWYIRYLLWCWENGKQLTDKEFEAWNDNPERLTNPWRIRERILRKKLEKGEISDADFKERIARYTVRVAVAPTNEGDVGTGGSPSPDNQRQPKDA